MRTFRPHELKIQQGSVRFLETKPILKLSGGEWSTSSTYIDKMRQAASWGQLIAYNAEKRVLWSQARWNARDGLKAILFHYQLEACLTPGGNMLDDMKNGAAVWTQC